jgi:hypothetical protein
VEGRDAGVTERNPHEPRDRRQVDAALEGLRREDANPFSSRLTAHYWRRWVIGIALHSLDWNAERHDMEVCRLVRAMLLAGCVNRAEENDATCRSYGATYGSLAYAQCRSTLDAADEARLAAPTPPPPQPYPVAPIPWPTF